MVTLITLRHAKSSWALPNVDDFDRPLNDRGIRDAPLIAQWLTDNDIIPDLVLCSSAERTRETFERMKPALGDKTQCEVLDSLYLPSPDTIRSSLRSSGGARHSVMVISHNPGLHEATLSFLTDEQRTSAGTLRSHFPTCACAVITFPTDSWNKIDWNSGQLNSYIVPKALLNKPTGNTQL